MKSTGLWILMSAPIHNDNRGERYRHQIVFKPLHHGLVCSFLRERPKEEKPFFFECQYRQGLYIVEELCKAYLVWSIDSL